MIPNGLAIFEEHISKSEEETLINVVNSSKITGKTVNFFIKFWIENLNNRKVVHYGYVFDYNTNRADEKCAEPPSICDFLIKRMITEGFIRPDQSPDQITVNFYEPGQGM